MAEWMKRLAGRFIVFDGPDGSGKTTQFSRFAAACREAGVAVTEVREPGGTAVGERIREVLLSPDHDRMSVACETLLYMASRAQLVAEVIGPARKRGDLVLADRFLSSTLAYQGTAGGLARADIMTIGAVAIGEHRPDLTVIFDVDEATAARRLHGKRAPGQPSLFSDRVERRDEAFHRRVREGFLEQARLEPGTHVVIDGSGDPDAVFAALLERLREQY